MRPRERQCRGRSRHRAETARGGGRVGYPGPMTSKPKVTLVTCASMPNLFHGEEGLPDELAQRGCDPRIAMWNDRDVDWDDAGMVVVRSVSDYAADRSAFASAIARVRFSRAARRGASHASTTALAGAGIACTVM